MLITSDGIKDFLITTSVVVVAVFLVIALFHLIVLLKRLNGVIGANEKHIEKSLAKLPETIENINNTAADVKVIVQKAGIVVGVVESGVNGIVASARGTTTSVFEMARTLGDVVTGISGFFNRRKKEAGKDEFEG